jgi:hypothetical protein
MKKLILLAMVIFATTAFAQIDPDTDGMGVYFDMGGMELCKEITFNGAPIMVNAYLLLTNPSGGQVLAWEANVVSQIAALSPGTWAINGGLNVGTGDNFIVGMGGTPHVAAPAVLLATRSIMFFMVTGENAAFTVGGVPGSTSFDGTPGYQAILGVMTPCQSPTGSFTAPQSIINGTCTIADEAMAWGSVKSLY